MAGFAAAAVSPLTELQKATAQAIVNIFETGKILGNYSQVPLLPNDPGHLTYGRSQTTLASGNLYLLVKAYCEASDAAYAQPLGRYLDSLAGHDLALDTNAELRQLLQAAGEDPVMHICQDQFFDRVYWVPAVTEAARCHITTPLGINVVYDGKVHGSFARIRELTDTLVGKVGSVSQEAWVKCYVDTRKDWLANHEIQILHRTVYRMQTFQQLITLGEWELQLPLQILGRTLNEANVFATAPLRISAHDPTERLLKLNLPPLEGDDVKQLQESLNGLRIRCPSSGVFDELTAEAVKAFQKSQGLRVDGIVGPVTRDRLGLQGG